MLRRINDSGRPDTDLQAGDIVAFGRYPPAPRGQRKWIEWLILSADGDCARMVSRFVLDVKRYHDEDVSVTWETCSLRKWLNTDFVQAAFSRKEQYSLVETEVPAEQGVWKTDPGNDTRDRVFLLSYPEARKYFRTNDERKAMPTAYAKNRGGIYTSSPEHGGTCRWWLRSRGSSAGNVQCVDAGGGFCNYYAITDTIAVRPAVVVRLAPENDHQEREYLFISCRT